MKVAISVKLNAANQHYTYTYHTYQVRSDWGLSPKDTLGTFLFHNMLKWQVNSCVTAGFGIYAQVWILFWEEYEDVSVCMSLNLLNTNEFWLGR